MKRSSPQPLVKRAGRPPSASRTRPVELRECRRHGRAEFARYGSRPGRHRCKCKTCMAEAVTRRHQKLKRTLVEEAGGRCAVCGYDRCVVTLQFHHVDPEKKSLAMSTSSGKALETYRAEARKCVLVGANCHGEIEAGLIESPPPGAHYRRR